jgi:hypothetical protein
VNGLTAARGLRRSVDDAGGVMRISVNALGDTFGRGRLTQRALGSMEQVLRRAGLQVHPSLLDPGGDGWVTLRAVPPLDPPPASAGLFMPSLPPRLAAMTGLLLPLFLVVAVAFADGPKPTASNAAPRPAPPAPSLLAQADAAMLAADYKRALELTSRGAPLRVPALRGEIVSALMSRARSAQRAGSYAQAIRLARRASRFGSAPGAARLVVQSRAGLRLMRSGRSAGR